MIPADEFAKAAGLQISQNDDVEERSVMDTNWSGQSDADKTVASQNNWADISNRGGLALGDFLAFVTFAAVGRSNHEEGLQILDVLTTAGPFLVSWFVISPFLGTYNRKATASLVSVPVQLIPGLLAAMASAMSIRYTYLYDRTLRTPTTSPNF